MKFVAILFRRPFYIVTIRYMSHDLHHRLKQYQASVFSCKIWLAHGAAGPVGVSLAIASTDIPAGPAPAPLGPGRLRTEQQARPSCRCVPLTMAVRGRTSGRGHSAIRLGRPQTDQQAQLRRRWHRLSAAEPAGRPRRRWPLPAADGPAGPAPAPLALGVHGRTSGTGTCAVVLGRPRTDQRA